MRIPTGNGWCCADLSSGFPRSLIWAKYEVALKNIQEKANLSGLIDQFFESADYGHLAFI